MSGPRPKKGLGQNFLADKNIAQDIVNAINPKKDDIILEIGPGRGTLTKHFLDRGAQVYAVEIDDRLLQPLETKFGTIPEFHLIFGDFLRLPWEKMIPDQPFQLVGNLPYHIASSVIFRCLDMLRDYRTTMKKDHRQLLSWTLMVQREVAKRITAHPGTSDFSILSLFCALEGTVEVIKIVPSTAFYPQPKVDGAVIRFTPHHDHLYISDLDIFNKLVRGAFSTRRKMLKNTLKGIAGIHPFWQSLDFDFTRRPETLSPNEWVDLANRIAELRNQKTAVAN